MIDQTVPVGKIIQELNKQNIPTSTIEKELSIASGYLWKVKKGKKSLGEEKLKELKEYHRKKLMLLPTSIKPTIILAPKEKVMQPVTQKVIEIKSVPEKKQSLASYLGPRPNLTKGSLKIK